MARAGIPTGSRNYSCPCRAGSRRRATAWRSERRGCPECLRAPGLAALDADERVQLDLGGPVTAPYASNVGDPRTRFGTQNCFADLAYTHPFSERLSLQLRAAFDTSLYQDSFAYDPPPTSYGVTRDVGWDDWASGDARVNWRLVTGTFAIVGVTGQFHRTLQEVYADDLPTLAQDPVNGVFPGDIGKDYATLNAYLLVDQQLAPTIRLNLGLTYYRHELFGDRLTPRVAAIWTPTPGNTAKLVYSQGFRPPTASEAFYFDGTNYLANPGLRPEVVDAWEAIFERRVGFLSIAGNAWFQHYTSLIRYQEVPAPGVMNPNPNNPDDYRQQDQNLGSLWMRGLELSVSARFGRWFQGYGGVSLQGVGAADLENFPSVTGNMAVASRALWEPLALAVNMTAASSRPKDPGNLAINGPPSVAPNAMVNAAATLDLPGAERFALQLSVTNLFGSAAPDPLPSDYSPLTELPQPPRAFHIALHYHPD